MPLFIDFLTSRDPKVESFVEIAKGAMQQSLDRYANAFDLLKLDVVEKREDLIKSYLALFTGATLENDALSSAQEVKIGRFVDKLFAIASFEMLNEKGELKKEIINAFQIDTLYKELASGEYSKTHKTNLANLQRMYHVNEDEAIQIEVRNAFVKGFVAEIFMSILRHEDARSEGNRLVAWADSANDNQMIRTLVDMTINRKRQNPLTVQNAIKRVEELNLVRQDNPALFQRMIYDDQFYKINVNSYVKSQLFNEIDSLQKNLIQFIKVLPKSKETQTYQQLFSANAENLLKEIQEKKADNDHTFTHSLIRTMKDETFKVARQNTSHKFFKGAEVLAHDIGIKLNNTNSLISMAFAAPELELKPIHQISRTK